MSTTMPTRVDKGPSTPDPLFPALGDAPRSLGPSKKVGVSRRKVLVALLAVAGVALLFWAVAGVVGGMMEGPAQTLVFYTVRRADLPITVTERGNLESQSKTEIACEVENLASSRSGNSGTQILFIVPNGKSVKKGELLVELDAAPLHDLLDNQVLATEKAKAEKIQANAKHVNQKTQNVTTLEDSKLQVTLAQLELKMYKDDEDGTYRLALREADLEIQEAKNQIAEANADLALETTELEGIAMLHKLGYKGKGELTQAQLKHLRAQGRLVKSKNQLNRDISRLKKLTGYEKEMEELRLEGALNTAVRSVAQVLEDNVSLLAQAEAAKDAADNGLKKEEEKLAKYESQLEKCRIYAEHEGMVVYATERSRYNRSAISISEGAFVRERQKILTLPDLSRMQVKTSVHESVLDQVRIGLPVTVRIDAFADRPYHGSVKSVGVLPDQGGWLSSDIKVYETFVTIDEEVEQLKPGMTAVVEIHVARLKDVLSVPVQAIVQIERDSWCYVEAGRGVERRILTLGRTNDKFIEIREGLNEGDRVVLNPMVIVDEAQQKQNTISPEGEEAEQPDDSADAQGPSSDSAGQDKASAGDEGPNRRGGGADGNSRGERSSEGTPPSEREENGRRRRGSFNLMQFDADGDGSVSREEVPERMRGFFDRLDSNGDGQIDAKEAASMRNRQRPGGGGDGRNRRQPNRTGPDA